MKSVSRIAAGVALAIGVLGGRVLAAEEAPTALPTLLIKGEVVSLDTSDPAAKLLTVKDRYGFETPIYVTQEAKITKGEETFDLANLATGTAVEVEYNFDINTAKRHAVSVKVAVPAATEQAAAVPAIPAVTAPAEVAPAPAVTAPAVEPAASTGTGNPASSPVGEESAPAAQ